MKFRKYICSDYAICSACWSAVTEIDAELNICEPCFDELTQDKDFLELVLKLPHDATVHRIHKHLPKAGDPHVWIYSIRYFRILLNRNEDIYEVRDFRLGHDNGRPYIAEINPDGPKHAISTF